METGKKLIVARLARRVMVKTAVTGCETVMKTAPIHPRYSSSGGLIHLLASNRATLFLLLVLFFNIVFYYQVSIEGRIWLLVAPACLLILNFLLALFTRHILKNNGWLMAFHFALIVLVLLTVLGQMTYFRATLELAENEEFSGQLENVRKGPWHQYGLTQTQFTNLGFQIRYHKGVRRDDTINQIQITLPEKPQQLVEIGDHVPLVVGHYRFYTSHNKGYAPIFEWRRKGSEDAVVGSIHLPAYPINEYRQALEWNIPGSQHKIWTMLQIDDEVLPEDRDFSFRVPENHRLVVRFNDQRYEIKPGDELTFPEGVLSYQKLTTWMGYKVDYDWTRPWLLATAAIGLLSLFLHFFSKFFQSAVTRSERLD